MEFKDEESFVHLIIQKSKRIEGKTHIFNIYTIESYLDDG